MPVHRISSMDRVKDYICFIVWFVGLSYVALWPMAVPDMVIHWLSTGEPIARGCGGLSIGSLRELCQVHAAAALSPGLHLIGMLAAFWVTARLMALLILMVTRVLLWRAVIDPLAPARFRAALRRPLMLLTSRRWRRPQPPRYVPPRREFGLRGPPR